MPAEKLYSPRSASRDYFKGQVGEHSVRRFIRSGDLKAIAVGVRRLIPESELEAFVKRQVNR